MAAPLIQLTDIASPSAARRCWRRPSCRSGGRAAVPGRAQRLGQVDAAKIAAGLVEADGGRASCSRARQCAICRRSPISRGFATTLAYVEAGLGPGDDPHRARYLLRRARPHRRRGACAPFGRRSAPRGAGARAGASTRYPAARRAHQPSRSAGHRMAGRRNSESCARRSCSSAMTGAFSNASRAHGVARPRRDAAARARFRRVRGVARRGAGRGGARPPQARPQDRRRGATGCAMA